MGATESSEEDPFDFGRSCCSSVAARRASTLAQGVCCGDETRDCVVRNSSEHTKMKMKQSFEAQLLLSATAGNKRDADKVKAIDQMKMVMTQEIDLNAVDKVGKTPLHLAVHSGFTEAGALLVDMGADPNSKDKENRTPLHVACLNNQIEMARYLLEKGGADPDLKDTGLKVPMHLACINGHAEIARLLIACNAHVETTARDILQPIHLAVLGNHREITTLLVASGASVDSVSGKDSEAPLHYASKFGHLESTELLIQMNATVDIVDNHGITPLHHAAHYDHGNVMKLLLLHGANPYAETKESKTALEIALMVGNFDAAVTLHLCYRRDGREKDFRMLTKGVHSDNIGDISERMEIGTEEDPNGLNDDFQSANQP